MSRWLCTYHRAESIRCSIDHEIFASLKTHQYFPYCISFIDIFLLKRSSFQTCSRRIAVAHLSFWANQGKGFPLTKSAKHCRACDGTLICIITQTVWVTESGRVSYIKLSIHIYSNTPVIPPVLLCLELFDDRRAMMNGVTGILPCGIGCFIELCRFFKRLIQHDIILVFQ